jgi:parvulin-like peptidyl-prolyl isomerase
MTKIKCTLVLICAAAPLLAFGVTADQPVSTNSSPVKPLLNPGDLFTNSILAKGTGVSVSRSQLDDAMVGIKASAMARGQSIPPEQMAMLEKQILQQLIRIQLLNARATDADKATGKEAAAKRIVEIKKQAGSDETLNTQLRALGLTMDQLTAKLTEEATAESVVKRELKANVTDDDVKKFYDENPAKFEQPESVRAAHVLIGTRDNATGAEMTDDQKAAKKKIAEEVLKKAKAGEDFAKLAKEYSDDPGSKDKGGEYTFPRGQMVPEFEAAAFSLNTNQVSDIVTTQFGYHIIKLYEKIPAKKLALTDKLPGGDTTILAAVKESLVGEAIQKQMPDYIKKAETDAKVEILDERLKPEEVPAAQIQPPSNLTPVKSDAK